MTTSSDGGTDALKQLVKHEPQRHPIVIGIVSPVGTPLDEIERLLKASLDRVDYETRTLRLSELIGQFPRELTGDVGVRGEKGYYTTQMTAGDSLRERTDSPSVLAARAVAEIAEQRSRTPQAVAFILRSLKHPDEHALLRQVYGEAFSLLAVSSSYDDRVRNLTDLLEPFGSAAAEAIALIERDEQDPSGNPFGQHVGDLFHLSDAYIPVGRGHDSTRDVDRFIDSLFGQPFLTPRPSEEAMKFAWDASLRSASMGRQVGAALVPALGTPVVVGTNEVPSPGGGQFWADDAPDHRDYRSGFDSNPQFIRLMVMELLDRLREGGLLSEEHKDLSPAQLFELMQKSGSSGESMLADTRVKALIEFIRCVHAEQAAIINAARSGVATQGATLYSTTFPCHECTKMIIGAGVVEVVYVVPYAKSLAEKMFGDLIDTQPSLDPKERKNSYRISFRSFEGIAPRRYEQAFTAGERRSGEVAATFNRAASPRLGSWIEVAVDRNEGLVIAALKEIVDSTTKRKSGTKARQSPAATASDPGTPASEVAIGEPGDQPRALPAG